ncbi:MAG: hypothetical protein AAGI11_19000 [Pseudomonadota bacterium]
MSAQFRVLVSVALFVASGLLIWQVFFVDRSQKPVLAQPAAPSMSAKPYAARDWEKPIPSVLNISVFLYSDRDRNGEYSTGDLPISGIRVTATDVDGRQTQNSSNINGYANFKMSTSDASAPISKPDSVYNFEVMAPPGWQVSSGNTAQAVRFVAMPGSVAGLVAEMAPAAVGLMPDLTVSGAIQSTSGQARPTDLALLATDPRGESRLIALDEGGAFQFMASPGDWLLLASSEGLDWQLERKVEVRSAPVHLMDIVVGEVRPEPMPVAISEDFDWLTRSVIDKLPNGHAGLNWDYLLAVHNQQYQGPGYVNGLINGHAVGYNSSGHPVTVSARAGEVFDFVGAYFSVAWPQAAGETLEIVAWRGGERLSRKLITLSWIGPIYLDADLRGIDKLTLTASHYWQFVVDEMRFRLAQAPLPTRP